MQRESYRTLQSNTPGEGFFSTSVFLENGGSYCSLLTEYDTSGDDFLLTSVFLQKIEQVRSLSMV